MNRLIASVFAVAVFLFSGLLQAADNISFIPSANATPAPSEREARAPASLVGDPLVFSAPPRESAEEAQRLYQPVADYLTRVLARPVGYVHPRTWLSYHKDMARGADDIVFDGAHFTSWRIAHLQHNALARIAEPQVFAVVARKGDARTTTLKQLAGKPVCAMGASNLATLTLLAEFDPMRQPLVLEHVGWNRIYQGLIEGRCAAAAMPLAMLRRLDAPGKLTKVLHQSRPLPNQAFSAGPRLTAEEQLSMAKALTSPEGTRALAALLAANGSERGMTSASREEYAGMEAYLKDVWGYTR